MATTKAARLAESLKAFTTIARFSSSSLASLANSVRSLQDAMQAYNDSLHFIREVIPAIKARDMAPIVGGTVMGQISYTEPVTLKQFVDDYHNHRPDDWLLALLIAWTLKQLGREEAYQAWVVILKCRPDKQRPRTPTELDTLLARDNPYWQYSWYRQIVEREREYPTYGV